MSDAVVNYCTSVSFKDVTSKNVPLSKLCAFCSAQRQKCFVDESVLCVCPCSSVTVSLCVPIWPVKYKLEGRMLRFVSMNISNVKCVESESDLCSQIIARSNSWVIKLTCHGWHLHLEWVLQNRLPRGHEKSGRSTLVSAFKQPDADLDKSGDLYVSYQAMKTPNKTMNWTYDNTPSE